MPALCVLKWLLGVSISSPCDRVTTKDGIRVWIDGGFDPNYSHSRFADWFRFGQFLHLNLQLLLQPEVIHLVEILESTLNEASRLIRHLVSCSILGDVIDHT